MLSKHATTELDLQPLIHSLDLIQPFPTGAGGVVHRAQNSGLAPSPLLPHENYCSLLFFFITIFKLYGHELSIIIPHSWEFFSHIWILGTLLLPRAVHGLSVSFGLYPWHYTDQSLRWSYVGPTFQISASRHHSKPGIFLSYFPLLNFQIVGHHTFP